MTATTMPTPRASATPALTPFATRKSRQPLAERGAGEGTGKHADQRDADLDRRQEFAGVRTKVERTAGPLDVAVDHRLEACRA